MSLELRSLEVARLLMQRVETITGKTYSTLTDSIQDLIDGYGNTTEGGSGSSESFVGVKFLEFKDVDGNNIKQTLPTIADARSLDGNNMRPERMVYKLFDNASGNNNGGMFAYLREVYMPSEPNTLHYTFQNCSLLTTIHGNLEQINSITQGFDGCASITEIPYMPNLVTIGANAFRNCTSLTSIKLYKKPTTFNANAFTGCTNLTDIYVLWAEGEVANAPWGAPNENLVIHYNTTYDENHNPITEVAE